jgi:hypothetical protein
LRWPVSNANALIGRHADSISIFKHRPLFQQVADDLKQPLPKFAPLHSDARNLNLHVAEGGKSLCEQADLPVSVTENPQIDPKVYRWDLGVLERLRGITEQRRVLHRSPFRPIDGHNTWLLGSHSRNARQKPSSLHRIAATALGRNEEVGTVSLGTSRGTEEGHIQEVAIGPSTPGHGAGMSARA